MPNPKRLLEALYGVRMQDGGKLPPGVKRATERAQQSKSVVPVQGARQARQAIQGYLGMDPSYSVMDPQAERLASAYRTGEATSVLGDIAGALSPFAYASALSKVGRVPGIAELIAYHGSPHKFKKFDASKIGTGEGAQSFGHGLYFAESPVVAGSYQTNLSFRDLVKDFRRNLPDDASIDEVLEMAQQMNPKLARVVNELNNNDWLGFDYPAQALSAVMKDTKSFDVTPELLKAVKDAQGTLYKVDIPDEKIAGMLDWDKPLSQQPQSVRDAINRSDIALRDMAYSIYGRKDPLGSDIARSALDPEEFAEHMRGLGIPGIRYLDRGSRGAGVGTSNFVLFPGEEQYIKMLEIDGAPEMAGGGAVHMQSGGNPMDEYQPPINPFAAKALQQQRMREEIERRRAEEQARQQTPLDTSLPGPSPRRPALPGLQELKGAFERRVAPVISEAKQTALTGGILGDILRAYGEYSVPANQAVSTALGRPFEQEFPPEEPPGMTVPTAFERGGDFPQQLLGGAIGDPANLLDPGVMRSIGAGAKSLKPFAKQTAEMVGEMAMKGVPGMEGTALRMGILPEGKSFPAKAADEMIQPSAAPEPISEDAAARAISIRPEQIDLPASDVITRGQDIPPMTAPPTPEQVAAARADTRMNADAVANRLNIIVPESERVIGGVYKAGRPDGGKWSDLTPDQLAEKGPGFPGTDADIERIWNESLGEVSEAARQAVDRTGATWKAFPAADYDVALQLPLRNQLWYELSGEAFVDRLPESTMRELLILLDLVGATSARARPEENLERAIAILSQRLRNVPIDVDITIPSTVTQALNRSGSNISSDLANKTGMFSDTMALTGGVPVRYPISVNDVWEGRTFGISDEALSKNQALHEVFGKFSTKLRDFVNEAGEFKYPLQSWNLQALKWVKKRFDDLGIDPLGPASLQGSDYAAEFDKIVRKLERAGIEVPEGKLTRDVLMNPRTADALRPTTPSFRDAPKATVEFGTLLTPSGKRAADIYEAAKISGDELTQNEYRSILTTAMYDSARGKPTPWESLARVASDRALSVTRIYAPNKDDPFAISGTFMGAAGPNIRIPLKELTPDQIAYFNSVAGLGLKQKAMAAAEILRLDPDMSLPQGFVPTHSIRFDFSGRVPETMLTDFAKALGEGFEISAMRYPDGMVFDINPRFGDVGPEAANVQSIDSAIDMLQQKYAIQNPKVFDAAYRSEYGKNYVEDPGNGSEYNRIIRDTLKGWNNEAAEKIAQLAGKSVNAKNINAFLAGKLENLPIDSAKLPSTVSLSSIQGRAKTIRKGLRQRLSDHDAALKAFNDIGLAVDSRMAAAIPKWDKRAAAMAKREQTKQGPEPEMAKGGRVHVSNNLDTMLLELMRKKKHA